MILVFNDSFLNEGADIATNANKTQIAEAAETAVGQRHYKH